MNGDDSKMDFFIYQITLFVTNSGMPSTSHFELKSKEDAKCKKAQREMDNAYPINPKKKTLGLSVIHSMPTGRPVESKMRLSCM